MVTSETTARREDSDNLIRERVIFSQTLENSLRLKADRLNPNRQALNSVDIISASLEGNGSGWAAIAALCNANSIDINDFKRILVTQKIDIEATAPSHLDLYHRLIPLSGESRALIINTRDLAARHHAYIDSGDILIGDLTRDNSIIIRTFAGLGVTFDQGQLAAVVENFVTTERQRGIRPEIPGITAELTYQAGSESEQVSRVSDVLEIAKTGAYNEIFVKREWLTDTLAALDASQVTVLKTKFWEETVLVLQGLSDALGRDSKQIYPIKSIIVPDFGKLIDNLSNTLDEAIAKAKGGVLVLPAEEKLFGNKNLQKAIENEDLKLLTYAGDQDWQKIKAVLSRKTRIAEVFLDQPTTIEAMEMVKSLKPGWENEISVPNLTIAISEEALTEAVRIAGRYSSQLDLPLVLGVRLLLDKAATNIKIANSDMSRIKHGFTQFDQSIDLVDVRQALKDIAGIEVGTNSPEVILGMADWLKTRIIGQEEAVEAVSRVIMRAKSGLKDPNRPIGTFLFLGPSGVGKTEMTKATAEFLFGSPETIRIDMSEYSEKHNAARLVGSPPGYIGYEEGGQLTEAVRRIPYSVLDIDEIEKAHPDVWNVFLQVMDDGRLTDGHGRTVDFRETVIMMTGNIGSKYFALEEKSGTQRVRELVMAEMKATFRPEFLNRFDAIIIFNSLKPADILRIVDLQIIKLNKKLENSQITLLPTAAAKNELGSAGYNPEFGVRFLTRVIKQNIEDPLSQMILRQEVANGDRLEVDFKEHQFIFRKAV